MFKRLSSDEFGGQTQLKSSVQRAIRGKICDQYPYLEDTGLIEQLLPKKEQIIQYKCPDRATLLVLNNVPMFFSNRDGHWFPTLRLLHQYPDMMPRLRADEGAIKFVLSGANIMCPGLTSPGATIHDEVDAETPVALYAEGKEVAMAIGLTKLSTQEIREVNKGIGVELMHHLNDGLWKMKQVD